MILGKFKIPKIVGEHVDDLEKFKTQDHRKPPYIYSDGEIEKLVRTARTGTLKRYRTSGIGYSETSG